MTDTNQLIERIANAAETFASLSGTGGMETAGLIISVLSANPDLIEPFFENPGETMLLEEFRWQNGRLSWHCKTGEVITPEFYREHLVAKGLLDDANRAALAGKGGS